MRFFQKKSIERVLWVSVGCYWHDKFHENFYNIVLSEIQNTALSRAPIWAVPGLLFHKNGNELTFLYCSNETCHSVRVA